MQIHFSVFLTAALLLLILPLDWIIAAVTASLFHELCHIIALYSLNGKIIKINVQADGCVIETDRVGEWKQFLSILAGPLGSFSLLLLCRTVPQIAICGLFQGLYNLIPVLPLDGGRLLRLLLYRLFPRQTEKIMDSVAFASCIIFDFLAIWFSMTASMGLWPILLAFAWTVKFMPRKIPCKRR